MTAFILLDVYQGKRLINVDKIIQVIPDGANSSLMYIAVDVTANGSYDHSITEKIVVKKSFDDLCMALGFTASIIKT